jgi:hypothetical protein
MQDELLRILKKLADLQMEILSLIPAVKLPEPPEETRTEDPKVEEIVPLRVKPGTRITWRDHEDPEWGAKARGIVGLAEYSDDFRPSIGIAYLKSEFTREVAWASAQRAWRHLRAEGRVPAVPYNCMRKAHTKDWYIWVYDPQMSQKKWVSERIEKRKGE